MEELTIGDKIYISSKQASKITGYAKDYVGQLCREGRVEARLVGRNWYVLESSIREHRFGAASTAPEQEVEEVKTSPVAAWEPPTYEAIVEKSILPPLEGSQEPVETPPSTPDTSEAVALMQDAWKEWFATREQAVASEPEQEPKPEVQVEVEAEAAVEEPEEDVIAEEELLEPVRVSDISSNQAVFKDSEEEEVEEPIAVTRVVEREESRAYEPVAYHTSAPVYERPTYTEPRVSGSVIDLSRVQEQVEVEPVHVSTPPIVKRRRGKVRNIRKGSHLTTQALLVSVAGLAVAIAVIGSGVLDTALATKGVNDGLRGSVIDTLRGETTVDKK